LLLRRSCQATVLRVRSYCEQDMIIRYEEMRTAKR
jgi:hypothetical protein